MRIDQAIEFALNNPPIKRGRRTLSANTHARMDGDAVVIRYFNTDIIRYSPDTLTMALTCGGWVNRSTLDRLLFALNWWNVRTSVARLATARWVPPHLANGTGGSLLIALTYRHGTTLPTYLYVPGDATLVLSPQGVRFADPGAEIPAALTMMRELNADRVRVSKPGLLRHYGGVLSAMTDVPDAQHALPVPLMDILRLLQEEIADREARPRLPRTGGRR
jgi:hypothetical protein